MLKLLEASTLYDDDTNNDKLQVEKRRKSEKEIVKRTNDGH